MRCSIRGCPGDYEQQVIVHTVRQHGNVMVIDHVPAEVCSVCGDTLLSGETVERIQAILRAGETPNRSAPLYEYA